MSDHDCLVQLQAERPDIVWMLRTEVIDLRGRAEKAEAERDAALHELLNIAAVLHHDGGQWCPPGITPKGIKDACIAAWSEDVNRWDAENARLKEALINSDAWKAPCPVCAYNGPGWYQPATHPCAALRGEKE